MVKVAVNPEPVTGTLGMRWENAPQCMTLSHCVCVCVYGQQQWDLLNKSFGVRGTWSHSSLGKWKCFDVKCQIMATNPAWEGSAKLQVKFTYSLSCFLPYTLPPPHTLCLTLSLSLFLQLKIDGSFAQFWSAVLCSSLCVMKS